MSVAKFYLSPFGRLSRKGYWLGWVLPYVFILCTVESLLFWAEIHNMMVELGLRNETIVEPDSLVVYIAADVLLFWPTTVVCIRRLHDLGMSGWWVLITLLNYTYYFVEDMVDVFTSNAAGVVALAASAALFILVELYVYFLRGNASPNAFGPPPTPPVIFGKARGALQT